MYLLVLRIFQFVKINKLISGGLFLVFSRSKIDLRHIYQMLSDVTLFATIRHSSLFHFRGGKFFFALSLWERNTESIGAYLRDRVLGSKKTTQWLMPSRLNARHSKIFTQFPPEGSFKLFKNIKCLLTNVKRLQKCFWFFSGQILWASTYYNIAPLSTTWKF